MSEGAGLQFSFQGEGLVIPPKPEKCDGHDEPSNDLKAYKVVLCEQDDDKERTIVAWWCDECVQYAPLQEEIFCSITRIEDGKVIYAEGQWHLD